MVRLSDDERIELRDTARRLLTERSDSVAVRALFDDDVGYDPTLWSSIAELDWLATLIPEESGGLGATFGDHAVLLNELGRQLTPSPIVSSTLAARALRTSPNESLAAELLPALASGEMVVAAALGSARGSFDSSQLDVQTSVEHGRVVFNGISRFVLDAHAADAMVVAGVAKDGGVKLALVDSSTTGVTITPEPTYDMTRRLATLVLDDVAVNSASILGDSSWASETYDDLVSVGAIAVICDAVGAAERILEMSNDYAKERFQFNRPIGSFQAVKHHLANMFADVEASRAAATLAVDAVDAGGDLRRAAAIAKSYAGPACARVAALAVQVHGGIGFTWEHDAHLFLKRVRLDEALFGSAKWHRELLAEILMDQQDSI